MNKEKLREEIAECFANADGSAPITPAHYAWADTVIDLLMGQETGHLIDSKCLSSEACPDMFGTCGGCPELVKGRPETIADLPAFKEG